MANKKSGFAQAQANFMKALRNFEWTVSDMAGFDQPEQKEKRKARTTKTKKRKAKKARGR